MFCRAILSENEFMNTYTSNNDPYDQYEVSVPIEIVGDCMAKVRAVILAPAYSCKLYEGSTLIMHLPNAYMSAESAYLLRLWVTVYTALALSNDGAG